MLTGLLSPGKNACRAMAQAVGEEREEILGGNLFPGHCSCPGHEVVLCISGTSLLFPALCPRGNRVHLKS